MKQKKLAHPERRWKGWAILEHDERLYRVTVEDPTGSIPVEKLKEMGWRVVEVEITARQ